MGLGRLNGRLFLKERFNLVQSRCNSGVLDSSCHLGIACMLHHLWKPVPELRKRPGQAVLNQDGVQVVLFVHRVWVLVVVGSHTEAIEPEQLDILVTDLRVHFDRRPTVVPDVPGSYQECQVVCINTFHHVLPCFSCSDWHLWSHYHQAKSMRYGRCLAD